MNYFCYVYDEDTDEDDKMTLRQFKDRHKKHGGDHDKMPLNLVNDWHKKHDDYYVGSDEDDKMPLILHKDRHKKHGDDEVSSDADDKMTPGKLKDMCKSKKRKLTSHLDTSRKQEDVNFRSDEDDDLKVHLSFSKSKLSKSLKAKKRCITRRVFVFPKTVMSVKTEQVQVSDVPMQLKEDSPLFSNIKAEIPEPESSGSQSSNLLVDSSSSEVPMLLKEHSLPPVKVKTETFESESFGQKSTKAFIGHSSVCCHDGSSSAEVISSEVSEIVERKHKTSIRGEEQQCCMLNEMSYEHLEYFDPESSPKSRGDMHANNPKKSFETEVDIQSHQLSNCCLGDLTNGCLDLGNAYTGKFLTACKLKRKYTESKHPAEHPHMASSSIDKNSKASAQVCQAKVIIDPNETAKRLKERRKGSPPDGNVECHRLSQSLPQFSTGFTSVQHFSASAIAFSERQMHDIESLAVKLMKELNSMKDIVEGQLQFKACSSASLKNEEDKVCYTAIFNLHKWIN